MAAIKSVGIVTLCAMPAGWLTYQQLLDRGSRAVPDVLRRRSPLDLRPSEVPVERYISREFFDLEVERLWKRVWQIACREEELIVLERSILTRSLLKMVETRDFIASEGTPLHLA